MLTKTDRNGSVHTYTFDVLGRLTVDAITTLGSGVDGTVRRVEIEYDGQGNAYRITTYDASSAGNVVNQMQREFNGLGQMTKEYQAVSGAVNTGSTPNVQYAYSFAPSGSTNQSRLTTLTYPNGRALTYNYATGLGDNISRLTSITDGGTTLESYEYLGLGTVVQRGHAQSGVDLTYIKQTGESDGAAGDKYIGLDFAGRVIDQRWTTSTPTAKDRFYYGYDRDSNRLYKENALSSTDSELYAYDNLNQITSMQRGTLNGTKTGLTGAATRSQAWDFDALGNFDSQTTNGTAQSRSHNKQNEITSIASATTPTYDNNGNLTKDETGKTFKFDAWNRLSEVKNSGGTTLATYQWDGVGRRTRESHSGTTTDLYYSAAWQVLEERVSGTTRISYAWSPVYIDAMIARDRDSDNNGSLEERLYVAQDANFNVTALIDTSGTVQERFQYDAFGSYTVLTGAWGARASSSYGWKYLHQGGRWDADAALFSFREREYSPTLGRWTQNDRLGIASDDVNLLRYVDNDAISLVDPAGLQSASAPPAKLGKPIPVNPPQPPIVNIPTPVPGVSIEFEQGGKLLIPGIIPPKPSKLIPPGFQPFPFPFPVSVKERGPAIVRVLWSGKEPPPDHVASMMYYFECSELNEVMQVGPKYKSGFRQKNKDGSTSSGSIAMSPPYNRIEFGGNYNYPPIPVPGSGLPPVTVGIGMTLDVSLHQPAKKCGFSVKVELKW